MPQRGVVRLRKRNSRGRRLRAADEDVVDRDVDQLDDVADDAHDQESDADGLRDADELLLVGLCAVLAWRAAGKADERTGAAVHEQSALLEELGGHAAHMLALLCPMQSCGVAYSANSLTFSMAADVRLLKGNWRGGRGQW